MLCFFCTGCAALPFLASSGGAQQGLMQTATSVQLSSQNYRIVKTNVVGSDWGINLLGIIPIVSPEYAKATGQICKLGELSEGKPRAIVNVFQQLSSSYFILFSITRISIRADVVEFTPPIPLAKTP
jgi:hypothetical protein